MHLGRLPVGELHQDEGPSSAPSTMYSTKDTLLSWLPSILVLCATACQTLQSERMPNSQLHGDKRTLQPACPTKKQYPSENGKKLEISQFRNSNGKAPSSQLLFYTVTTIAIDRILHYRFRLQAKNTIPFCADKSFHERNRM
jgi:hypothetical protein